ncbi:restriction endonuclease subunit S, partial [Candidatus Saccharibacteria bacterium]|nr:restriction endonuclease subunit S [Candidatus Saccharibacteria bacterium]
RGNGIKRDETVSTGKPCVRYGEMYTTYRVKFSDIKSHTTSNIFDKCQKFHKDDILMALTGENKWDIALAAVYQGDQEVALGGDMCKFSPFESNSLYLVYLINSPYGIGYKRETSTGDIIVHTSVGKLGNFLIPLPPLAEQKRIVAKLEQVLPLAEEYGAAQEQLDKLNKELPEALKKSILQEAIQGKLVPQNSKDEPAQKLLERIAASRNGDVSPWSEAIGSSKNSKKSLSTSLRGAKATKQSKNPPSRIYRENGVWYEQIGTAIPKDITDEIPFEIPETWAWCRLGNCSDYAASKEKAKSFENIQEMWSLDLEDIEKNSGRIVKRLKVRERKIVGEKVVFKKGQVLYSKLRPYLKKILVAPEDGVCSSEIVPFSPFEYLDADYLVTVLKSPHVDYTINLVTYGVKMPRVGTDTMLNLLIPLPPLAEQKRIVDKLEQLFKVL